MSASPGYAMSATGSDMPLLRPATALIQTLLEGGSAPAQGGGVTQVQRQAAGAETEAAAPAASTPPVGGGAEATPSAMGGMEAHDLERIAREVYYLIEERLIMERESMGL